METSRRGGPASWLAWTVLVVGATGARAEGPEAGQESLRSTEQAFAATAERRDLEAFRSFLADDVVFTAGERAMRGPAAVVEAWAPFFAPEGPEIRWQPESVEVLGDGRLGMTRGPYQVRGRGPDGQERVAEGTFFSVWRRTGQEWKIVFDGGTEPRQVLVFPEGGPFAGLEWLVGSWRGSGLGGEILEVWSEPAGGAMLGMFRLIKEGEVAFYELETIAVEKGELTFRVKHFHADLVGWEEKADSVAFPFLSKGPDSLVFDGLAYHRDGEDGLRIELRMQSEDGTSRTETLELSRIR